MSSDSDKDWYKLARQILKAGGPPVPINEMLIELLKTLINDDHVRFLLNFRKPLNFDQVKSKINLEDHKLHLKLNELMDIGILTGIPSKTTGITVYRLVAFLPGLLEFTLMKGETGSKQQKIAKLWEQLFEDTKTMTQENYDTVIDAFKNAPAIDRVIPIESQVEPHEEIIIPSENLEKLIEKFDLVGVSHCYCRHRKNLLNDPCKMNAPVKNCLSFGRTARFVIDHGFAEEISKSEALRLLREAEDMGLVHRAYHTRGDPELDELAICNCCKCCCGNFGNFYRGAAPTSTLTSYIAFIDNEKCIGCGNCVNSCPMEAPFLEDAKAELNEERCIGCGICTQECPEAIKLKRVGLRRVFVPPPHL